MRIESLALLVVALALAGCSGGGSSGPSTPTPPTMAASGAFDTSFGQGGIASADPITGFSGSFSFITPDSSGTLLAIGSTNGVSAGASPDGHSSVLARLLPNGQWDTTLAQTGFIFSAPATTESRTGVAVYPLPGDQVLVVQQIVPCDVTCPGIRAALGASQVVAQRLSHAGVVDASYGTGAIAGTTMRPTSTVLLANQSLAVVGPQATGPTNQFDWRMDVFGPDGLPASQWSASARSWDCPPVGQLVVNARAALLPTGQLLVARPFSAGICLTRFNTDGTIDLTYGLQGHSVLADSRVVGMSDAPNDVLGLNVAKDGTAIMLLQSTSRLGLFPNLLVWITPAGQLDVMRGQGGVTDMGSNLIDVVTGIAVQADGKVLVIGFAATAGGRPGPAGPPPYTIDFNQPRIARYLTNGNLDMGFGSPGLGYASLAIGIRRMIPGAVVQGPDGAIYVAGGVGPFPLASQSESGPSSFAVAKLHE